MNSSPKHLYLNKLLFKNIFAVKKRHVLSAVKNAKQSICDGILQMEKISKIMLQKSLRDHDTIE